MKNTNGFTLVELMVAILVLAIGLLGLAGLQVTGLSSNHNAYLRTQATLLAQDMADRMRDNRGNLAAYAGTYAGTASPASPPCEASSSSPCSSADLVGSDIFAWTQGLAQLPGGVGTITAVGGGVYTISIQWNEHEDTQDATKAVVQKHFDMNFQP